MVLGSYASIGTMHLAKGLEFCAVVVIACDDEIPPSQERIEWVGDDADLQEVYDTERHFALRRVPRETIALAPMSTASRCWRGRKASAIRRVGQF